MTILLNGPGPAAANAVGVGGGKVLLSAPLAGSPSSGSTGAITPGSVSGLSGWWDGGAPAGLLGPSGAALSSMGGGTVASFTDLSGSSRPMVPTGTVQAAPRINVLLGGVGSPTGAAGLAPQLDPTIGFQVSGLSMGSGAGWTRYLVWTRPNLRMGTTGKNALPVALLTIGTTVVLRLDSVAGGQLILFPGASQTVLSVTMERRHTHNVILRYTVGAGVDVWLDGVRVASGAPNPLPASNAATLTFLSDTTSQGAAQCWFNEAATWERALSSADVATLIVASARWVCGPRRGVNVLAMGQSNCGNGLGPRNGNAGGTDAWFLIAQGLAWHIGAASYGVIGFYGQGTAYTCIGGHGIYNTRLPPGTGTIAIAGTFLADPGDGSDPAGWALGADGTAVQTYLAQQSAADLADIAAIVWPWFETDSTRAFSEGAFWFDAAENLLGKVRTLLGRSAASLPLLWWHPMPFWDIPGLLMCATEMAAISAVTGQNAKCVMPMTANSNPKGATWNATTGQTLGDGDYSHLDGPDLVRIAQSAAGPAARAVLTASGGDTIASVPAGVPNLGPYISHAYRQSNTVIIVTVTHDIGTDLVVPLQASTGIGWGVMDGGSEANPATVRTAIACVRVDATHLQITLGSALTSASSGCSLFYPYGNTWIYRGNAVTDNAGSVSRPASWDIGADLGSAWDFNLPLQSPNTPIALSDSAT